MHLDKDKAWKGWPPLDGNAMLAQLHSYAPHNSSRCRNGGYHWFCGDFDVNGYDGGSNRQRTWH